MPAFLFTDIQGSTRLWEQHPQAMARALQLHDLLLENSIKGKGGRIIDHTGDGVYAVFEEGEPVAAALSIQQQLAEADWGEIKELLVRIGMSACPADQEGRLFFRDGDAYHGPIVNEAARVMAVGWGGQTLVTPGVLHSFSIPSGTVVEELGRHVLDSLSEPRAIYSLTHPTLPEFAFPPLRSLSVRPNNLPSQPAPFVGREQELTSILRTLKQEDCRLLTLVGPGGAGKTRLAIQAAAQAIGRFANGVYFVPLASVRSPEFIVSNIASALAFSFYEGSRQVGQLLNYLREKQLLLVIDNIEHLPEVSGVIAEILQAAPRVKVLATGRIGLGTAGERRLEVHGLAVPESQAPLDSLEMVSSVQLFLQAARRVLPEFALTEDNWEGVLHICRVVGGMPLGLELAAAWTPTFTTREIAREIERNLDFLGSNQPDVPDRHRSLYAVCDYFVDQMAQTEKAVLGQLGVFSGGFTVEAAREVAGASAFFLSALIDRAWLHKGVVGANSPQIRYEMHQLLRQYATEKVVDQPVRSRAVFDRHCDFYSLLVEQWTPFLISNTQSTALAVLEREMDNVHDAWQWAVLQGRSDRLERFLDGIYLFHDMTNRYQEAVVLLKKAIRRWRYGTTPEMKGLLVQLLNRLGFFYGRLSDYERAQALLAEALALMSTEEMPQEMALAFYHMGINQQFMGDYTGADYYLRESLALFQQQQRPWFAARALGTLAFNVYSQGDLEEARAFSWEAYLLFRKLGDERGLAARLNALAAVMNRLGEVEAAVTLFHGSLKLHQHHRNLLGIASVKHNLGILAYEEKEYLVAKEHYREALVLFRETGQLWSLIATACEMGLVFVDLGLYGEAKQHFREALQKASTAEIRSLVLDVLSGMAHLQAMEGQKAEALALLEFVLQQPALDQSEGKVRVQRWLTELESQLPFTEVVAARQQAETFTLDSIEEQAWDYLNEEEQAMIEGD